VIRRECSNAGPRSWSGKEPEMSVSIVLVRREERAEAWRRRSVEKETAVRAMELS
jgi:hypothetical protein